MIIELKRDLTPRDVVPQAGFGCRHLCLLTGNSAAGGGAAFLVTLNNCVITGNSASQGGGVSYCVVNNCLLTSNTAGEAGGGAYFGTLNNCTLFGNASTSNGGTTGDGILPLTGWPMCRSVVLLRGLLCLGRSRIQAAAAFPFRAFLALQDAGNWSGFVVGLRALFPVVARDCGRA